MKDITINSGLYILHTNIALGEASVGIALVGNGLVGTFGASWFERAVPQNTEEGNRNNRWIVYSSHQHGTSTSVSSDGCYRQCTSK
jgi:hypothetical protein